MRAVHRDVRLWCFRPVRDIRFTLRTHADGRVWLHTGDVGTMDNDGFIYFKQRLKRLIIADFTLCIGRKLAVVLRIDYLIVNVRIRYSDTALAEEVTRGKAGRRNEGLSQQCRRNGCYASHPCRRQSVAPHGRRRHHVTHSVVP